MRGKEKENGLLIQIERLQLEKQQALEENHSLTLEIGKPSKEREEKTNKLLAILNVKKLRLMTQG